MAPDMVNPVSRFISAMGALFQGALRPETPVAPPEVPVRLPDLWAGYRLRPIEIGGVPGWALTSNAGLCGFLHQRPQDNLWTCIVFRFDEQPREISQVHMTPEGALVQFLDER